MRRTGNLYDAIADPENLQLAFWRARRGKDGKPEVEEFRRHLDRHLDALRRDLLNEAVEPGPFHRFTIHDPKDRLICAAPFRDRVLHHAIMNVCEPAFERYQVSDSYACRRGKGLHAALQRAVQFTRRHTWYLKLDVRKYFDRIAHDVLRRNLARRFKDARLLRLFTTLIDGYAASPGRGIPIGNLTSQYFANDYLAGVDHRVKEILYIPGYVRYMDDVVLWHDDRDALLRAERDLRAHCQDVLGLELKPLCLNRTAKGVTMLGYRVFPGYVALARRSRTRFAGKLRGYWNKLQKGEWNQNDFAVHVLPLSAYVGHARSTGFRRAVMVQIGCSPQARTA